MALTAAARALRVMMILADILWSLGKVDGFLVVVCPGLLLEYMSLSTGSLDRTAREEHGIGESCRKQESVARNGVRGRLLLVTCKPRILV